MQSPHAAPGGLTAAAALAAAWLPSAVAVVSANATLDQVGGLLNKANLLRDRPLGADYSEETVIVRHGRLSVSLEAAVALLWVMMVCSLPLVIIKLRGDRITRSEWGLFAITWITIVGGLYLFTNILLFESVHFEGVRSLTIVECIYLFTQMLTTVGYGDIVPAKPRGQVFVALYVLFNLMVLAHIVSEVVAVIQSHAQAMYLKLKQNVEEQVITTATDHSTDDESSKVHKAASAIIRESMPEMPWKQLLRTSLLFLMWCVLGVVFFCQYPGEGRSLFDAIYMSVITLSTVGFGVFTPLTEAGKVFGAFWMLFGSGSLMALVGSFTELMVALRTRELFIKKYEELHHSDFFDKLPERMDLHDFMRQFLISSTLAEEQTLDEIDATFKELGPDEQGQLSKEALAAMLERRHILENGPPAAKGTDGEEQEAVPP